MQEKINKIKESANSLIKKAQNKQELNDIKVKVLGKKLRGIERDS